MSIEAFSAASLDYPHGETRRVWLNDGNVPFLDVSDGRHLGLFIASLLILVILFIPYTLLLLTSQWLQIKSHWKILSWLNKPQLRAFLDAYHAPYKPQHRYWTGVLLLARLALLLASTYPKVSLLTVQCFVFLVQMWVCRWRNLQKVVLECTRRVFLIQSRFACCVHLPSQFRVCCIF